MPTLLLPEVLRIGVVVLVAIATALAFAWRRDGLARHRVAALLAVRTLGILVLLVLLSRPVWTESGDGFDTPHLVVLLDRSQSMSLVEDGESRYQRASRFAREQLVSAVEERGWEIELHEFAEEVVPVALPRLGRGEADGSRTDLGRAIGQAVVASPTPPLAVVALTDGVTNAHRHDRNALGTLLASNGVFVGIATGSDRNVPTLTLERLVAPSRVAPEETFALSARLRAVASGEVPAFDLLVFRDGHLVDQRRVAARPGSHSWMETFERVEAEEGAHHYTVRIAPGGDDGPILLRDEASGYVRVSKEDEIRVLFVQGALTWDFKFVRLALTPDPVLSLTGVSRTSERSIFRQGVQDRDELVSGVPEDPAELAPFRVVVLAGVGADELGAEQQETLSDYVSELGGGLLMIGGPESFAPDWRGSRLEEALPVRFDAERGVVGVDAPFRLEVTDEAMRSSVFRVSDTEAVSEVWEGLPAFDSYGRVAEPKAGATVWAVHERDSGEEGRRVLMAAQPYGAGRSVVIALQNFWRWRLDRDAEPEHFDRFWQQLFRYLAQVGRQEVNVFFPSQDLHPGEEIRAVIERSTAGEGEGSLRHHVTVDDPTGAVVAEHEVELGPADAATIRFPTREEGIYQVRVRGSGASRPVVEPIEIRRVDVELERTARDLESLAQWASMSDGFATAIEDVDDVGALLDRLHEHAKLRRKDGGFRAAGLGTPVLLVLLSTIAVEVALRFRWGLL